MKKLGFLILILSGSFLLAQNNSPASTSQQDAKNSNGQVTVRGCVSRAGGDYTLIKQDPAITYELQGSHKIKLSHYLGQRVEVTGNESPSLSTSSDAINGRTGSPSPVTLTVSSIRTIDKDCPARPVSDK
jgi:hypothetical protein